MDAIYGSIKGCFNVRGDSLPTGEKRHRGGSTSQRPGRVLFNALSCPQEGRHLTTSNKSETSKRLYQSEAFQDGDAEVSYPLCETRRLAGILRSQRRILTRSHTSKPSAIPKVCLPRRVLPVQGSSFRPKHSPDGLDKGPSSNNGDFTSRGNLHFPISRRSAHKGYKPSRAFPSITSLYRRLARRRLCNKRHKIGVNSNTGPHLCGRSLSHRPWYCYSATRPFSCPSESSGKVQTRSPGASTFIPTVIRPDGKYAGCHSMGQVSHASITVLSKKTLASGGRSPVHQNPYIQGTSYCPPLVDQEEEHFQGKPPYSSPARHNPDNGRFQSGMGRFSPPLPDSGSLDCGRVSTPHQYPRITGHFPGSPGIRGYASRQGSPLSLRQHDSLLLHSKDGRNSFSIPPEIIGHPPTLVHPEGYSPPVCVSPRRREHTGRPFEQNAGRSQGMGPSSTHSRSTLSAMGDTIHRSVCVQTECQAPSLLFSLPRSELGIQTGRVSNTLEQYGGLCFSTQRDDTPGHNQSISGSDAFPDLNRSSVDKEDLVSTSRGPPVPSASPLTYTGTMPRTADSDSARSTVTASTTRPVLSGGLANHRHTLEGQGFSEAVVATILARRSDSTYSRYSECWKAFSGWCETRSVDPFSAAPMVVLEYLQNKLETGQATSTIRVHASAISAFHNGLNGINIGQLPIVSRFLAGAAKLRPPPVVLPTWSLQPVLDCLTKYPWEPIHEIDLKYLTLKTVFLLAVTSARRVSELQALCLDGGCYRFITPDILLLRTNVNFMPKCKTEFHRAQEIQLEAFYPRPTTAKNKKLNSMCPIRALQAYVERTKDLRKTQQLFVSYKKGAEGFPVTKRRISSWMVEAIKLAYQQEGLDSPKNVRAHGTRAQATSWASFAGVDPTRICRAAVWSNLHTFCKHYRTHQLWEGRGISNDVLSAVNKSNP